jgi:hypothetical protein
MTQLDDRIRNSQTGSMIKNPCTSAMARLSKRHLKGDWTLAKMDAAQHSGFISQWRAQLGLAHVKLPSHGFGELRIEHPEDEMALTERGIVRIEYALSEADGFAAFRTQWVNPTQDATQVHLTGSQSLLQNELFFVNTATGGARFGVRSSAWIIVCEDQLHHGEEIDLSQSMGDFDDHWLMWLATMGVKSHVGDAAKTPGFMELAQLMLNNGQLCTDFSAMRASLFEQSQLLAKAQEDLADKDDENRRLRHQVGSISSALSGVKPATFAAVEDTQADSSDLAWLPQWVAMNGTKIAVMPRALGAAKKSRYENPEHIRSALEYLAGPYRQCRLGQIDQDASNKALMDTGSRIRGSAGISVAGTEGDAYFVMWNGRRRFMDMHITRGGGRDQRYCMRIYFFWDAESQMVVVGHLPSHLNNSLA